MSSYTIYKQALAELMKDEGCELKSYQDTGGVWTIGYGHTKNVTSGMVITQYQALDFLNSDMTDCANWVNNLHLDINQNQFTALCDLAYNCGSGNMVKWGLITMVRLNPNNPKIADVINSNGIHDRKGNLLTDLVKRRAKDVKIYFS
jgi:lysozyme